MAFTRVNLLGWGTFDSFTSAQANTLDQDHANAFDIRSGQTNAVQSVTTMSGAGRIVRSVQAGPDANSTILIANGNAVRVSSITASRTYTLSTTGAQAGDVISFFIDPGVSPSFDITIKDQASVTMYVLGNGASDDGQWVDVYFDGAFWDVARIGQGARMRYQLFTTPGAISFTVPRGVTSVMLVGCGGGGGGGGGAAPGTTTSTFGTGGGGGGGAVLYSLVVPVTSLSTITGTLGAGGPAGSAGLSSNGGNGGDGVSTTFGSTTFAGGSGGMGGVLSASSLTFVMGGPSVAGGANYALISEGGPQALTMSSTAAFFKTSQMGGPGISNAGLSPVGTFSSGTQIGMPSPQGYTGGSGGSTYGANSGTGSYYGGGCGGGGGAGPGGNGGNGGSGSSGVNGGSSGVGGSGVAGTANTGAGGGGGGASGAGSVSGNTGGAGGAGGSGFLYVCWVK